METEETQYLLTKHLKYDLLFVSQAWGITLCTNHSSRDVFCLVLLNSFKLKF